MSEQECEANSLPRIVTLHERHPGLTESQCGGFEEAASVCLSRHHIPPIILQLPDGQTPDTLKVDWTPPDDRVQRAWNNVDDTTENGAYGISIAALESQLGLMVVARAETRTGADWYLAPESNFDDLENAYRLEVSGSDRGSERDLNRRLGEKVEQARRGKSSLPAIACVVGILVRMIRIQSVDVD
jgi:hypothetical protein